MHLCRHCRAVFRPAGTGKVSWAASAGLYCSGTRRCQQAWISSSPAAHNDIHIERQLYSIPSTLKDFRSRVSIHFGVGIRSSVSSVFRNPFSQVHRLEQICANVSSVTRGVMGDSDRLHNMHLNVPTRAPFPRRPPTQLPGCRTADCWLTAGWHRTSCPSAVPYTVLNSAPTVVL